MKYALIINHPAPNAASTRSSLFSNSTHQNPTFLLPSESSSPRALHASSFTSHSPLPTNGLPNILIIVSATIILTLTLIFTIMLCYCRLSESEPRESHVQQEYNNHHAVREKLGRR